MSSSVLFPLSEVQLSFIVLKCLPQTSSVMRARLHGTLDTNPKTRKQMKPKPDSRHDLPVKQNYVLN